MSKIKVIWNEACNKSCYHDESLHHFCNQDTPWFPLHQDKCHCLTRLIPVLWQECSWNLQVHLISWQNLAHLCMQQKMFLYRLRPKHHSLDHIQMDIARTKLNPARISSCFSDESFLGYLKRIGVRCHSSNMMLRLLQRYILFLSLRWKDSRTKWHGVLCASHQSHGPVKICQRCLIDVPSTAHTLPRCRSFGCFVKLLCSFLIQYIKVDLGIRTGKWKSSDLVLFGYRFTHVRFWFDHWMVFQPFLKSSRRWPAGCCFLVLLFMIVCGVIPIYIYVYNHVGMLGRHHFENRPLYINPSTTIAT